MPKLLKIQLEFQGVRQIKIPTNATLMGLDDVLVYLDPSPEGGYDGTKRTIEVAVYTVGTEIPADVFSKFDQFLGITTMWNGVKCGCWLLSQPVVLPV